MEEFLDLLSGGVASVKAAWTLGAIAVLAVILKFLVDLTKTKFGQALLVKASWKHKWVRPVVACVLGFFAAGFAALAAQKPWAEILVSAVGGVIAALTGVGLHEAINSFTQSGREGRAAAASVPAALTGSDEEVKAKVEVLKAELDKAMALPSERARVSAIAAHMLANPPKKKAA